MKKIYIKQLLTAILLLCSVVVNATVYSGTCGTNVNWSLDTETGVLEITGTGAMTNYKNYPASSQSPWSNYSKYITSINISNGITNIGDYAFAYCSSLTSVTIPNSVTTIGISAFYNCSGLTSITIPNSVTSIGKNAFCVCTGLTSIEIPNSVTTIGQSAFAYCSSLTSVTIPNSVTTIGQSAFAYCSSLTSVTIPNSVTTIGERAFYNCSGLTSIEIPNSVTTIGESAFCVCTGLTSIEIPNSVTTIGISAFSGCSSLTSIEVESGNTKYDSRDNCNAIIETAINTLIAGCAYTIIPNSVTTIGQSAFQSCMGLTSITIPNSVTTIGISAFSGCSSLTSVTIPNSVTTIGERAFFVCTGLTSIEIPNSVTTIGQSAFAYCSSLTSVTIPNSVTTIGESAFYDCTGLTEIYSLAETPATIENDTFSGYSATLYVPAGAKAAYQAADYWKNFTNIVEMTPTEETPTEVTITIGQYGTATYCSPYALDFSEVEGLKAYTATGYNSSTGVVTLTRAQTAEDATGLFLMGEPGEYRVPVIEYSSDYMLNMLVGTLEATAVNNKTDDGNYINFKYTIGSESSQPMFYQFEDGSTLSAGKAYLQLPARLFTTTASKSISLRFDDGRLTDIDRVESESNDTQTIIYDLCGRRVSKPAKGGIYIKNGKKIIL